VTALAPVAEAEAPTIESEDAAAVAVLETEASEPQADPESIELAPEVEPDPVPEPVAQAPEPEPEAAATTATQTLGLIAEDEELPTPEPEVAATVPPAALEPAAAQAAFEPEAIPVFPEPEPVLPQPAEVAQAPVAPAPEPVVAAVESPVAAPEPAAPEPAAPDRVAETVIAWPHGTALGGGPNNGSPSEGSEEATSIIPAWQPSDAQPESKRTVSLGAVPPEAIAAGTGYAAKLTFESGPFAGRVIALPNQMVTFGRAPDNDIVVGDPATSGRHGRIEVRGGQFWISDLGSTNGTLVNGEPVLEKQLAHGDVIAIGQNVIRFTLES
jgi:hypothetical protein